MATIDTGRKEGGLLCTFREELGVGPCLIQRGLGQGLLLYQVVSLPTQTFGHNRHEPKTGGACAPFRGQLGPHLTQCGLIRGLGLPPYQVVAVWPQETWAENLGAVHGLGRGLPAYQVAS